MTMSFEAIRKQLEVNTTGAAQQVTTATSAIANKTVETAKSIGSAVHGVLPVTNNKLDARTEDLLRMIAASTIRIQNLENAMGTMGFAMPEVQVTDLDVIAKSLMAVIKAPRVEAVKAPEAPVATPVAQPQPTTPVAPAPVVEAPIAPQPQVQATPIVPAGPSNPMMNQLPMSEPSNWHLGPQA